MTKKILRGFEAAFRIRPEEFWRVQLFFLYFLSIGMFYTLGEAIGDALFLSRIPQASAERLFSWIYIGIAVATVGATLFHNFIQERVSRIYLMVAAPLALAASLLIFRQAIRTGHPWVYFGLNIWLEACALLSLVLFFSFTGDYFTSRDARRVYAYIAGGSALGTLLAGWAVEPLANLMGPDNLLYICAGLLAAGAGWTMLIARITHPVAREDPALAAPQAPIRSIFSNAYLRGICALVLVGWVCSVVVDYQMKVMASRNMQEAQLAAFFGKFYAYGGAVSLAAEFLLVGWLLNRFGIMRSMLILPVLLALASLGFFFHPTLVAAAAVNFIPTVLSETLDLPARELLFVPLASRIRLRAQALVDGVLVPVGYGLGGAVLIFAVGGMSQIHHLAPVAFGFSCLWIFLILFLVPLYQKTLTASLARRHFDPAEMKRLLNRRDAATILSELLRSPDPEQVASALDLLRGRPLKAFSEDLQWLTTSSHELVAVSSLRLLAATQDPENLPAIRKATQDPREAVASAAILALCEVAQDDAVAEVIPWLNHPELSRRRAALLGMALHGGFEGALAAYPRLDELLKSSSASARQEAAKALAALAGRGATRAFKQLLADPEPAVRREAICAVGAAGDFELIPSLLKEWGGLGFRPFVLQALIAMPQEATVRLAQAAGDRTLSLSLRSALARILGNLGGRKAAEALWDIVKTDEETVFLVAAAGALHRLKLKEGLYGLHLTGLKELREHLCEKISLVHRAELALGEDDLLEKELFLDHGRLQAEFLLHLLALEYDARPLANVEASLYGGNETLRANAFELLEIILPRAVSERVVPLLAGADGARSSVGDGAGKGLSSESAAPLLKSLLKSGAWIRVITLFHLNRRKNFPEFIGGENMKTEDQSLYRVVTIVSFLKQVELFRGVAADYLTPLAEIVEERHLYAGEILFSEGDAGDALYLICEGCLRVMAGGREVAVLGPRECIGEMALLDGAPRSASVKVLEEARLLRIASEDFRNLLPTQPGITTALLQTLARRLRQTLTHPVSS